MPVWHSSVAFQTYAGPKPVAQWTRNQIEKSIDLVIDPLKGTAPGSRTHLFITQGNGKAMHAQRALTDSEIQLLPEGWMEIEAIDELGPVIDINPFDPVSSVLGDDPRSPHAPRKRRRP